MSLEFSDLEEDINISPQYTFYIKGAVYENKTFVLDTKKKPTEIKATNAHDVFFKNGCEIIIRGNNVTLKGLSFQSSSVALEGDNIRITDCKFIGVSDKAAITVFGKNCRIDNNTFSDTQTCIVINPPTNETSLAIIDHNAFDNVSSSCVDIKTSSDTCVVVAYNTLDACNKLVKDLGNGNIYYKNAFTNYQANRTNDAQNQIAGHSNFIAFNRFENGTVFTGNDNVYVQNFVSDVDDAPCIQSTEDAYPLKVARNIFKNSGIDFDIVSSQNAPEHIHLDNNIIITTDPQKQLFSDRTTIPNIMFSSNLCYGKTLPVNPLIGMIPYSYEEHIDNGIEKEKECIGIDNDRYQQNWSLGLDKNPLEVEHNVYYERLKCHIQNQI